MAGWHEANGILHVRRFILLYIVFSSDNYVKQKKNNDHCMANHEYALYVGKIGVLLIFILILNFYYHNRRSFHVPAANRSTLNAVGYLVKQNVSIIISSEI